MSSATTILGTDAVTGEPTVVASVAAHLRAVSSSVGTLRDRLESQGAAGWTGGAADAFRGALDEVPGELVKLTRSYDAAASTVSDYATTLETLRSRSDSLARQITELERRLAGQHASQLGAQRDVGAAKRAHAGATDPEAQATANRALGDATLALSNATGTLTTTRDEIATLRRSAHHNRIDFEDAVKRCCKGLDGASDLGIRNSVGTWYDRHIAHGGPVGELFDHLVVAPFRDTAQALKAFIEDPSLKNFSAVLGGVGEVLALVGTVVLLVALGVGTGGMAFAAGGALLASATAVGAGKLAVDGYRSGVNHEPGAGEDILDDAIGLAVPGVVGRAVIPKVTRGGVRKGLVGAGRQMARQEARYAASPSPWSQGWVTRTFNVVQPNAVREPVGFVAGALLDPTRPTTWSTGGAPVPGTACPATGPLFSPTTLFRHPIPAQ